MPRFSGHLLTISNKSPTQSKQAHSIFRRFGSLRFKLSSVLYYSKMFLLLICFILNMLLVSVESGKECEFAMRLVPGFNPFRQVDDNGKECRGNVELPFCKGYCKTSESGTHGFPSRVQNSKVCTLVTTTTRKVILPDCDVGADESIKFVMVPHGTDCECSSLPLEQNHS